MGSSLHFGSSVEQVAPTIGKRQERKDRKEQIVHDDFFEIEWSVHWDVILLGDGIQPGVRNHSEEPGVGWDELGDPIGILFSWSSWRFVLSG